MAQLPLKAKAGQPEQLTLQQALETAATAAPMVAVVEPRKGGTALPVRARTATVLPATSGEAVWASCPELRARARRDVQALRAPSPPAAPEPSDGGSHSGDDSSSSSSSSEAPAAAGGRGGRGGKGKSVAKGGGARGSEGRKRPALRPPHPATHEEAQLVRFALQTPLRAPTLEGFARALKKCKRVVVCVGAGASVAAGIPDFRTPGKGLYSNQKLRDYNVPRPEDVFSLKYFKRRPDACYAMLGEMWPGKWPPTRVHYFLRLLESKQMLQRVYTQNIDDLERIAGVPPSRLVEAHGTFAACACIDCGFTPGATFARDELDAGRRPICPECVPRRAARPAFDPRRGPEIALPENTECSAVFVYGTLRPDDSSGLENNVAALAGCTGAPAVLRGVRLYHDRRPVIRIPDPTASLDDVVQGYLLRTQDAATFAKKLAEFDVRLGCPVLCRRAVVAVEPKAGGPAVAAFVYHNPDCATHTAVPFGDWERRRDWRHLPPLRGLVKPTIVFFDEDLPEAFSPEKIRKDMSAADAVIVVGTSLRVTPFCWLPQLVRSDCPRLLLTFDAREVGQKAGLMLDYPGWRDAAYDGDCQTAITHLCRLLGWEEELVKLKAAGDAQMHEKWRAEERQRRQVAARSCSPASSIEGQNADSGWCAGFGSEDDADFDADDPAPPPATPQPGAEPPTPAPGEGRPSTASRARSSSSPPPEKRVRFNINVK